MKKIISTLLVAVVLSVATVPFLSTSCEAKRHDWWNCNDEIIIRKNNKRGQGGWISVRPGASKGDQIRIGVGF